MTEKHKLPIIHYLAICKSPFVRFDNFCKKIFQRIWWKSVKILPVTVEISITNF